MQLRPRALINGPKVIIVTIAASSSNLLSRAPDKNSGCTVLHYTPNPSGLVFVREALHGVEVVDVVIAVVVVERCRW